MKYDEVSAQAGSSKKKGAAESDYLSEAGDVAAETAQKNEGAPPRKKGSAKKDPKKIATKIAEGKAKAEAKKGAVKKDVMMDEKPVARKKGAGRTVEQLKAKKKEMKKTSPTEHRGGVKGYNKKIQRLNKKIERKGGAKHIDGDKGHKKEAEQTETVPTPGAAMGFTQNFGPARQNSYARGAAKVAQIMGKGAFKKKGAADHEAGKPPHPPSPSTSISQDESDRVFTPAIKKDENANTNAFIKQANNYGNRLDFTQSPTEVMNKAVNVYSNSEDDFVRNSQGYGYGSKNLSKYQLKSLYGKYKDPNYKQKKS